MAEDRKEYADGDPIHTEAMERFDLCEDVDSENRINQIDDIKFVKLLEQWPENVRQQREQDGRPCLTVDQLGSVVRQVVNDSRLNKPQIKVKPVDSKADPKTAEILAGLIRNIEYSSNSDVAYDTAIDYAVTSGRGYFRINAEYATDDTFDQDLVIEPIADPLSVYPDPFSTDATSADWNFCFVVDSISEDDYEKKYRGKDVVSWDALSTLGNSWFGDERAVIAEYWKREEIESWAILLSTNETVKVEKKPADGEVYEEGLPALDPVTGQPVIGPEGPVWVQEPVTVVATRPIRSFKVTQYILSGKEILETVEWPGTMIPIIPVYGQDFVVEGRRHFSSLIRPAKDAQRMKNYWRSTTTELVALAPKAPWVGPEKAFNGADADKWATANSENHAFLSYPDNVTARPERQAFSGVPAGALQEALNASDDIKSITGIYDASLGARSNETSGVAINARQREGDVSTFHYIDNLARGIKHAGRILIDLIPHYYSSERVIRVLDPEGEAQSVQIGSPEQAQQAQAAEQQQEAEINRIYALGVGKYDVAVDTGPSFTTQREEFNAFVTELIRALPQYADIFGPFALKSFDAPGVDKLIKEVERRQQLAEQNAGQPTPEQQEKQAEMQLKAQEGQLKAQEAQENAALEREKLQVEMYRAETERLTAVQNAMQPRDAPRTYA